MYLSRHPRNFLNSFFLSPSLPHTYLFTYLRLHSSSHPPAFISSFLPVSLLLCIPQPTYLTTYHSICPATHPSIHPSIHVSTYPGTILLSFFPSCYPPFFLFLPSLSLPHIFTYLPLHSSSHPPIHTSNYIPTHIPIFLPFPSLPHM